MHEPTEPIPAAWACQVDARDLHDVLTYAANVNPAYRDDLTWQRLDAACSGVVVDVRSDLKGTIATVLDLIGAAQRASDPGEMVRLMREATATMDAHRVPEGPTETPHCAGDTRHAHPRVPMLPIGAGWFCPACPEHIIEPVPDEDRPEPDEAPLPSWDRLREIADRFEASALFGMDRRDVLGDLRAIADDYEAMAGREIARQKATTGPDLAAQLTRARRIADERGRYIEALESVFCSDGVPEAVTRAMEDLRPVPAVVTPLKIADLERVLDEIAREEARAEQWDGSISDAADRLRAAVALARETAT